MSEYKMAYMQFFPGDFLNGILYLNNEEVGMYIKMICASWETQTIPKKRVPFLIQKEWDELSEELKSKFIDYGDSIVNKRVNKDLQQYSNYREKQSINGKKGGRPKTQKNHSNSNSNSTTNSNTNSNSISNNIYIPPKDEFLEYGLGIIKNLNKNPKEFEFQIESKYDTWVDDHWRDGHNKQIKNWKNKLKNSIQYFKPIYENRNSKKSQDYSDTFKEHIIKKLNA